MKERIGILNLGCPRNIVDSESILGRLARKGYKLVDLDKADVAIINTCAFIEEAKKESVDAILDLVALKNEGRIKKIIVAGCLAQRYKEELKKELPEVDAFIGKFELNHSLERFPITPKHYGYLKICESCVNNCSFCVIPKIKGRFSSITLQNALERVGQFDKQGVSELNIIGQDISAYGLDIYGERALPLLLSKIIKKSSHIGWFRLLYLYPDASIKELIPLIRDETRICKYIDLPIQHINERILRLMNRRTGKNDILSLIDMIRENIPGVAIRTSIIVGFPGESEKEFNELLKFIQEVKFERLGAFVYSREEGTQAFDFRQQVPEAVKARRLDAVMSCQQEVSLKVNKKFLGQDLNVLIDEQENESGLYLARSEFDAPEVDGCVYIKSKKHLRPGDFVGVRITDTYEYDLIGEAINEHH